MSKITVEEYLDLKDKKYLDKDIAKKFGMQQSKLSSWKNSIAIQGQITEEKRRRLANREKQEPVKPTTPIYREGERVQPLRSKTLDKPLEQETPQRKSQVPKNNKIDNSERDWEEIEVTVDIEEHSETNDNNPSVESVASVKCDPSNEEYENLLKQLSSALEGTPIELSTPANDELIEYRMKTHHQAEEIDGLKKEVYELDYQLQNHIKKSDALYKENMKLKAETIALRKLVELYIPAIS
ncbi:hypothetical protein [Jeotgalibacillus terrae]|uniref:Helix-turn-helix domain-containing protein n=1 Tax=Jeotgalibacillus terrae TaxID=587735 RepID=A0ABW5ZH42_9BACL|nr:hypothetical protein [Jeotgalibacillus terrae]MBM7580031.1 hypothetical protein [Jeotgalibacillus terrae]